MSNSVITFLSDLGTRDASVTIAKAVLNRYVPEAVVIDISHNVAQYDLQQAAYLLRSCFRHFPKGAVHIVAVDVFAGDKPRILLAEKEGYYFIVPDNGVLPLAFGKEVDHIWLCHEVGKPQSFSEWINNAGSIVETVNSGKPLPYEASELKRMPRMLQPKVMSDGVDCNVLYVDRYENVVLDITRAQFEEIVKDRPFTIKVGRGIDDVHSISSNYNDVPEGEPLCRFNSAGFLEIAINHGTAASLLGLGSGSTGDVRYQTIKVYF